MLLVVWSLLDFQSLLLGLCGENTSVSNPEGHEVSDHLHYEAPFASSHEHISQTKHTNLLNNSKQFVLLVTLNFRGYTTRKEKIKYIAFTVLCLIGVIIMIH